MSRIGNHRHCGMTCIITTLSGIRDHWAECFKTNNGRKTQAMVGTITLGLMMIFRKQCCNTLFVAGAAKGWGLWQRQTTLH
jgi:hypothetical protein